MEWVWSFQTVNGLFHLALAPFWCLLVLFYDMMFVLFCFRLSTWARARAEERLAVKEGVAHTEVDNEEQTQ
jgi:hypothetical protein